MACLGVDEREYGRETCIPSMFTFRLTYWPALKNGSPCRAESSGSLSRKVFVSSVSCRIESTTRSRLRGWSPSESRLMFPGSVWQDGAFRNFLLRLPGRRRNARRSRIGPFTDMFTGLLLRGCPVQLSARKKGTRCIHGPGIRNLRQNRVPGYTVPPSPPLLL